MFDLSVSKFEPPRVAVSPVRRRRCRTPSGAYSHVEDLLSYARGSGVGSRL